MDGPHFLSVPVRGLSAFAGVPTAASLARDPSFHAPVLLHLNECPFPPSALVIEAICRAAAGVNRYGEPQPDAPVATLATKTSVAAANIVVGNGSDEILGLVSQMALVPKRLRDNWTLTRPTTAATSWLPTASTTTC